MAIYPYTRQEDATCLEHIALNEIKLISGSQTIVDCFTFTGLDHPHLYIVREVSII